MLFNSIGFALFFILVFTIWWLPAMQTVKRRNILIIITGSFFYGCWDIRFLALLYFTATVDYFVAKTLEASGSEKKRKRLLLVSLISNLSVLGFFKYFNFFADTFAELLTAAGFKPDFVTLRIVLPVGISFYTFQALSYTIDVYRKRTEAVREWDVYYSFITFFPQLVAGPIARAAQLVPQLRKINPFSYSNATSGLRLLFWGFFKKCVIADNMASFADSAFSADAHTNALGTLLGTVAFAIQAYGDFSGYSDIAKGTAQLLGIELTWNFRFPYFANTMRDYWHRWHISMSFWFRDYVYIPLGGSQKGFVRGNINIFITFVLSGLWHGANWTYVMWGVWHGIAQPIENTYNKFHLPKFPLLIRHVLVICVAWGAYIFLRSPDIQTALNRFASFGTMNWQWTDLGMSIPGNFHSGIFVSGLLCCTLFMFAAEWLLFKNKAGFFFSLPKTIRITSYYLLIIAFIAFGVYEQPPAFIYFQF